jgi:glycosidase
MMLMKGAPCIYYGTEVGMEGGGDPGSRGAMVWDANQQDAGLTAFFKKLIALRKEHNDLIQNAVITYAYKGGLCRWKIAKGRKALEIAYNAGDTAKKISGDILIAGHGGYDGTLPAKTCVVTYSSL